jgi:cell division protein FtsQ
MATTSVGLGRERRPALFARRLFLRPDDQARVLRKGRRRRRFGPGHVLALLALQAALFAGLREAYLFVITWDELSIREVRVAGARDGLRRTIENFYAAPRLGNILLCDLEAVRAQVRRLAWVKDASVQKVFPAALRITVVERTPFALLERGGLRLADEDGHVLGPVVSPGESGLPTISDETGFATGFTEKWSAARRFLQSLPQAEKDRLLEIRCSDYGTLELAFRDDPVRIVVGTEAPAEALAVFRAQRADWEKLFGPLRQADLSLGGRVYLRPAQPSEDAPLHPDKGD